GALVRVRASGVRVLDLEDNPAEAAPRVLAEMRRAVEMDGVESVVLGCAGMVTLLETARAEMPVNVIDGVEAAARLAWALSMVRQ
ncbi:MAG: aspartate/glutamate racemase family protein, partial [Pseudomonadota bacterium]|nr:aspartate/glutamate racemase family protein [Pseudomonadota bacterium]